MALKPALGKGLGALFANAPVAETETQENLHGAGAVAGGPAVPVESGNRDRHPGISLANVEEIKVNPYQPRREFDEEKLQELVQSIEANGIIQPLIVRKSEKGFELIAGERRLRAAKRAGLTTVPIVIRKSTDRESLEIALIENIQRADLNCVDEALAYLQLLQDFNLRQEDVAQRVGKDRATVANHLRLLKLPENLLEELKTGKLSFGHGKAIMGLEQADQQIRLGAMVLAQSLSVRDTEALVQKWKSGLTEEAKPASPEPAKTPIEQRLQQLSLDLTRTWSVRVEVKGSDKKGKIVFRYRNREDLERLLEAMQKGSLWQNPSI